MMFSKKAALYLFTIIAMVMTNMVRAEDESQPSNTETSTNAGDVASTSEETKTIDSRFIAGFTQSFVLIFLSEIGDRTFILVTIYASKVNFCLLFLVSITGMYLMHVLSTVLGATILPLLISKFWTEIICIVLFFGMGVLMLYQAIKGKKEGDDDSDDERKEIEMKIQKHEEKMSKSSGGNPQPVNVDSMNTVDLDSESQRSAAEGPVNVAQAEGHQSKKPRGGFGRFMCFYLALLMCEEWGDKSQITAIALAPNYNVWGIIFGGMLAHTGTILFAQILGVIVQKVLTERTINIIGGILFVGFGVYELLFNVLWADEDEASAEEQVAQMQEQVKQGARLLLSQMANFGIV